MQTKFSVTHFSTDITEHFDEMEGKIVTIAGRLMSKRGMGKVSFCDLQDKKGRVQLYVRRDLVGEDEYAWFKKYDTGDIVGVTGEVFRTEKGQISVRASQVTLLVKALQPLPEKFHGLTDQETRYRQRYVDLIVNPDVKDTLDVYKRQGEYILVLGVIADQFRGDAHKAPLTLQAVLLNGVGPDGIHGQKGAAAGIPAFQVSDGGLAVLLPLHHDILHGAPQGDFDGHGVLVGHLQQPRHRAPDPRELTPVMGLHHRLDGFGIALIQLLHLREHVNPGCQGIFFHGELHHQIVGGGQLFLPGLAAQLVAVDDIGHLVPLFPGLGQLLALGLSVLCLLYTSRCV